MTPTEDYILTPSALSLKIKFCFVKSCNWTASVHFRRSYYSNVRPEQAAVSNEKGLQTPTSRQTKLAISLWTLAAKEQDISLRSRWVEIKTELKEERILV